MCVVEVSFDDIWQLGLVFKLTFMLHILSGDSMCLAYSIHFSQTRGFSSPTSRVQP